ncbi:hypothetical protein ACFU53_34860 [Streptomyces sp. NPDC057474]|uniref:hypothetical protein n=1 Tax=Streptomyces sp. NPDC057474 TaxID=3346144 RepID=UPI00367F7A33
MPKAAARPALSAPVLAEGGQNPRSARERDDDTIGHAHMCSESTPGFDPKWWEVTRSACSRTWEPSGRAARTAATAVAWSERARTGRSRWPRCA